VAETFDMIAKTFFGLEGVLVDELETLGALDVRPGRRMAAFRGDTRMLVRANLGCRTAVRILKPIATFTAADEQALYRGVGQTDWLSHLDADGSLAIDPVVHSAVFSNSLYAAQLAKDAIVDQIRAATGQRPSVDLLDPGLRINLHIDQDRVTLYLDSSGGSLHKRGYRGATGKAPLNEVLAAGILRLSGWDENSPLADFMCGSGTLVIEAALMARRIAPGLVRRQFGYLRWKNFDRAIHDALVDEAGQQVRPDLPFPLQGSDLDPKAIAAASDNARRAGVAADIRWLVANFESVPPPAASGTLIVNPPYDERMKTAQIAAVYQRIGDALKRHWPRYTAHILTGNLEAAKHIGLRASGRLRLFNGPIECRLLKFELRPAAEEVVKIEPPRRAAEQADEFRGRLARMAKHWHRWARRQGIACYRLYDRDIPDVPLAIDWYEGHAVIGRYRRPHNRTEIEQRNWLDAMAQIVSQVLDVPSEKVTFKGGSSAAAEQGAKHQIRAAAVEVHEVNLRYEVRLAGSQHTGLELDRRILRGLLRAEAAGKRFLNLFARTGTSTVAAAAGCATETTTVETSRGLLAWAERNIRLNTIAVGSQRSVRHELVCQDPIEFVRQLDPADGARFDLACVEPPGFDGKRRAGVWNVQDGHVELLNRLLECMSPGGRIYFVTTFRRLKLHAGQIRAAKIHEITRQTVPPDFRNKKIHRAWSIVRTADD
jgi:23S rRNA (guanine2069-N7)-methyltransferase / 23S rRNA (guanine2445-N2)-methyltransferase